MSIRGRQLSKSHKILIQIIALFLLLFCYYNFKGIILKYELQIPREKKKVVWGFITCVLVCNNIYNVGRTIPRYVQVWSCPFLHPFYSYIMPLVMACILPVSHSLSRSPMSCRINIVPLDYCIS